MRVLVACEFSGIVRDAFAARGHDAWSCDLLPSERLGRHFQRDVRDIIGQVPWDLMIAHPPCTYLCRSGQRWLTNPDGTRNGERWGHMVLACEFFNELLAAPIVQPWEFGHPETKATCLWLVGLPPLMVAMMVQGRDCRIHNESPSPERWKKRSVTYQGIAAAMAEQWGNP